MEDNTSILKIHPNPAKEYFIAEYKLNGSINNTLEMVDVTGKIVKSIILKDIQNQIIIETVNLKTGIYYIHLVLDGKINKTEKLSIIKN